MLHIDLPTRADILRLAETRGGPCVTIYLATTPLTESTQADRIDLKNQLKDAVAQLDAVDTPKRSIWPIEAAVTDLIEDDAFWAHQANSLAIFVTPETIKTFRLPNKLNTMVAVSDRFHIKPILRAVTFPHNAYVLAIGRGGVRLIEVSADLPPHVVSVPGLPRDMADALDRRSGLARDGGMRSGEVTSENALLTRYGRTVDEALRPVLSGHERPLIVAAAEPLSSVFRSVSSYPHTASEFIGGSADHTPDHELAASARGALDRIYAAEMTAMAELYGLRSNQGRTTADIAQAARAATFGAIDTLIVDIDQVVPGTVSDEDGSITFADAEGAASYGVVDEIASRALKSGARVVSARKDEVPGGGALAAILRYPM